MLQVKWLFTASQTASQKGYLEVISSTLPLKAIAKVTWGQSCLYWLSPENLQTWQILYLSRHLPSHSVGPLALVISSATAKKSYTNLHLCNSSWRVLSRSQGSPWSPLSTAPWELCALDPTAPWQPFTEAPSSFSIFSFNWGSQLRTHSPSQHWPHARWEHTVTLISCFTLFSSFLSSTPGIILVHKHVNNLIVYNPF